MLGVVEAVVMLEASEYMFALCIVGFRPETISSTETIDVIISITAEALSKFGDKVSSSGRIRCVDNSYVPLGLEKLNVLVTF